MGSSSVPRVFAQRNNAASILFGSAFASAVLEETGACRHVVRTILETDDLEIVEAKGQHRLPNLASKDAMPDAFAQG